MKCKACFAYVSILVCALSKLLSIATVLLASVKTLLDSHFIADGGTYLVLLMCQIFETCPYYSWMSPSLVNLFCHDHKEVDWCNHGKVSDLHHMFGEPNIRREEL
jgi:hypothetical protein